VEFYEIDKEDKVSPGEYVLHEPTQTVVLCGVFSRDRNEIKALGSGRLIEDSIGNFKKIKVPQNKKYERKYTASCGSCKKI
jgi:hypothetical protein|tara:strand:- start:837 stop:1079 length:243 start_codon:yes stop_codon:yes gene_type:complete